MCHLNPPTMSLLPLHYTNRFVQIGITQESSDATTKNKWVNHVLTNTNVRSAQIPHTKQSTVPQTSDMIQYSMLIVQSRPLFKFTTISWLASLIVFFPGGFWNALGVHCVSDALDAFLLPLAHLLSLTILSLLVPLVPLFRSPHSLPLLVPLVPLFWSPHSLPLLVPLVPLFRSPHSLPLLVSWTPLFWRSMLSQCPWHHYSRALYLMLSQHP